MKILELPLNQEEVGLPEVMSTGRIIPGLERIPTNVEKNY